MKTFINKDSITHIEVYDKQKTNYKYYPERRPETIGEVSSNSELTIKGEKLFTTGEL